MEEKKHEKECCKDKERKEKKHKKEKFHEKHRVPRELMDDVDHLHGIKRHPRRNRVTKTKLFTDRQEMIDYVNTKGDEGHHIDIFRIEEGLYKVVIVER